MNVIKFIYQPDTVLTASDLEISVFDLIGEIPIPGIEGGLEQAARSYGFLRSLNLTGASVHSLIDCIAINVLR